MRALAASDLGRYQLRARVGHMDVPWIERSFLDNTDFRLALHTDHELGGTIAKWNEYDLALLAQVQLQVKGLNSPGWPLAHM
jgi:hypothetical protein